MNEKDYYSIFRLPAYTSFDATLSPKILGQFDPMNLVVSMSSEISEDLHKFQGPICTLEAGTAVLQSFATYLHETMHWWQHIGSTSGLITGLGVPIQAHMNHSYLCELIQCKRNFNKPLVHESMQHRKAPKALNFAVNNWMDLEFAYSLLNYPFEMGKHIVHDIFFDSLGHALHVLYDGVMRYLSYIIDPDFFVLPDVTKWTQCFQQLCDDKHLMHYYGSTMELPPIGIHALVEGQARFQELQYRHVASRFKHSWNDFREQGLLGNIYIRAFELFLDIIGKDYPESPISDTVNMFLLLCDIAMNPNSGYPDNISNYSSFIRDVSPGVRFLMSAQLVRLHPELTKPLVWPDKSAHIQVTSHICDVLQWKTPCQVAATIVEMTDKMPGVEKLKQESKNFEFDPQNMPLRFIYARHLEFVKDKAEYPEFFCWPAFHQTTFESGIPLDIKRSLLIRHCPMFVSHTLGGKVKLNAPWFEDSAKKIRMVSTYFLWQIMYDIVRQWIARRGRFSFKYPWTNGLSKDELKVVSDTFKTLYSCDLEYVCTH